MKQLYPEQRPMVDALAIYDDVTFGEPPSDRPFVYVNMVSSVDGRAQVAGRSAGLGSRTDQSLMARLRAHADCIINGAGTARIESVYRPLDAQIVAERRRRGQADQPLWAILTASGDAFGARSGLPDDTPLFDKPAPPPIVFVAEQTPATARERLSQRAEVIVAGRSRPEVGVALKSLRERYGCRHVLLEGGPRLNHSTLKAGLADELFLTLGPKIVAGAGKTIVHGRPMGLALELVTLYEHESELFLRYRVGQV